MDIPGGCKQTKQITGEARPVNKTRWVVSQPDAGRIHCPGFFQFNPIPSIHFGAISAIENTCYRLAQKIGYIYIYMYVYIYTYIYIYPRYSPLYVRVKNIPMKNGSCHLGFMVQVAHHVSLLLPGFKSAEAI